MKNWLKAWWWVIAGAVLLCGSGVIPAIIPQAVPTANRQGSTGTKFLIATGGFTAGHYLSTDASGNAVDGGVPTSGYPAVYTVVTYSATPTFTVSTSSVQTFYLALTGNVTSSTLATTNATSGQPVIFIIKQDSTARTVVLPTNVLNACEISTTASSLTIISTVWDGANANATGCITDDTGTLIVGPTRTAPATPGPSTLACWFDSASNSLKCKDASANVHPLFTDISGTATTAQLPTAAKIKPCEIVIGDPGAGSPVLADDNDAPATCGNVQGADLTITAVACWADAGSPTVTPILTGGAATSILTGALTCGTGAWATGTVNGTPVQHSFAADGATCSSTPCTLNANITTAGGTAKYLIVRITRTL
jgi:hypothetical protein